MQTYIALLRGINVGSKKIKMTDLKVSFEELGFTDVVTYIQSGNVVFNSTITNVKSIQKNIETNLLSQYNFEVPVLLLKPEELKNIIEKNPFTKDPKREEKLFYVVFLFEKPKEEFIKKLYEIEVQNEEFYFEDSFIYLYPGNGYGEAKMNNNFFENKLKVKATTRNWNTVNKLLEMAS